ncbi:PREDICTED: uncharacterized protein LOC105557028 [Vollenhovia emeryi]|uniref:uncharacterized protein LOC105557028 n=1 Tax=Vollenhovia emeryi TaxID=411798 RepID=UPI0005F4BE91|nr:PREDICTED: uncharacterized protein LOC105557028 [Vollenhovia emeryi]
MPFGLCNAPATFERLMEEVLGDFLSRICLVYLDDVIIFGKTFEQMLHNLKKVFLRIREVNLRVNPKKCVLFARSVKYLGHVISSEGISTDPEKISAIKDWPQPYSKKQLRSFLGFCSYYRKFIRGFSSLAKPLYELTGDHVRYKWSEECQCAFEKLKGVLSSSSVLSCPKQDGEFVLDTDASNIGIGAVLSQRCEGVERVIAYFSRVLNKSERNYCVTRRELLAVVDPLKFFRHYLLGRRFLIRTDHVSLRWLMSFKDLEGQLARWLERLQQYDFEILYRKGRVHGNADGLSRRPCESLGCTYCKKREEGNVVEFKKTISRIILDGENLDQWRKDQKDNPEIALFYRGKELGILPYCVSRRGPTGKGKSPLQIYNVGSPFERVQIDVLVPLPTSTAGNRYLLVVIDCFSKWVEAFPVKNIRAKAVAEVFVNQIISRHRIPGEVHTDQGRNFESKLFSEIMTLLGIKKTRTTPLHPQTDGQVERQHRTILDFLAKFISDNQKDWDRWIPMYLLAYRSSKHETTGVSPSELCYGRDLRLPLDLLRGCPPVICGKEDQVKESFLGNLKGKLDQIHSSVRERMEVKSSRMKSRYDQGVRQILFQEGQKVWLFNPKKERGKAPKLQSSWEGPFLIDKKLSDVVFCIRKSPKHRCTVVHADRFSIIPFDDEVSKEELLVEDRSKRRLSLRIKKTALPTVFRIGVFP